MRTEGEILSVAIAGAGGIGSRHAVTLAQTPGVRLAAVADPDAFRLAHVAEKTGASIYQRWDEMLEREKLDALFVCTPPAHHAAPALAALATGADVFLEKPMARTWADAETLVMSARRSGAVCAMGYQWRAVDFLPEVATELQSQQVGLLAGRSLGPPAPRRSWFLDWEKGGGILLELASHDIDLQRALVGEVTAVQAAAGQVSISPDTPQGFRSVLSLSLLFASGAVGTVAVAACPEGLPTSWALDIVSDRGAFFLRLDPEFTMTARSGGRDLNRTVSRDPSQANISRFIDAVRAGDPRLVCCDFEEGAKTLQVALACERALETGATVPVNGEDLAE
jgi:myo-inositol 2-dehydrogenase / D-chiro-inositol 1-dehydrogenase